MKTKTRCIFLSLLPSLMLGFGGYYLISLLNGMEAIENTSLVWFFLGWGLFIFLFVSKNNGQNIFGRFLRYAAYECWVAPFCAFIYTTTSISQANNSLGSAGAIGAAIGGSFVIYNSLFINGLIGLVLYLISKEILKNTHLNQETIEKSQAFYYENEQAKERDRKIIKILQYICPASVALVLIFVITNKVISTYGSKTSLHKGYSINYKEQQILDILLNNEMDNFSRGAPSALAEKDLLTSSSRQIARDYNNNQVAADQLYFKRKIRLIGNIESINSGLGNQPYIMLDGINSFLLPQAHFNNGNTHKIAQLRKGQQIFLVCRGNGSIIGTPMFNDCQFAKDYVEKEIGEIRLNQEDFLNGKRSTSKVTAYYTIVSIIIARALPQESACFSGNTHKCLVEIKDVVNDKNFTKKTTAIINELNKLGIDTSQIKL